MKIYVILFILMISTISYGLNKNFRCPDGSKISAWYFCQRARECADIEKNKFSDSRKKRSDYDTGPPGYNSRPASSNSEPPESDSGSPGSNTGLSGSDSGPPGLNSGPPGSDSGSPGFNTGLSGSDSGPPGLNSGPPGSDSGSPDSYNGPSNSRNGRLNLTENQTAGPPGHSGLGPDETTDYPSNEPEIGSGGFFIEQPGGDLSGDYSNDYSGSSSKVNTHEEVSQSTPKEYLSCELKQCAVDISSFDVDFCQNTPPCQLLDPNYYQCDEGKCLERATICDRNTCNDCPGVDDWPNGVGFKCFRNKTICKLPQQLLYDDVADCDDAADLCFPRSKLAVTNTKPTSSMDTRCFECMSGGMIVRRTQVCDGVFDCKDLSDECLCDRNTPSICDEIGLYRSPNDVTSPKRQCGFGELSCGNGTCVNAFQVMCDSNSDCSDNKDEKYEYCKGTMPCRNGLESEIGKSCRCHSPEFTSCKPNQATLCNLIDECPLDWGRWSPTPGYPDDECEAKCPNKTGFGCIFDGAGLLGEPQTVLRIWAQSCNIKRVINGINVTTVNFVLNTQMCDGTLTCTDDYFDENEQICKNRFFCPSLGLVNIPKTKTCDGTPDCDDGSDELNTTCPHRFFCKAANGKKVSIESSLQCDYIMDCDNGEDEMNCDDERFYCEDHKPLFVLQIKTFNGIQDCEDWSDECPTIPAEGDDNIFSSRYELIANPILRALVWIMAILAIVGNLVVGFNQIKTLYRLRYQRASASAIANHILVLNLAISDLLMGIYLILLGGFGLKYAGRFCSVTSQWLTSNTCNIMGILSVLSSESSVITLALLTACRLHSILRPFQSSLKPKLSTVIISLTLAWAISFTLALVPLSSPFQSIFVEDALISGNPFFRYPKVSFAIAKNYVTNLFTFGGNMTSSLDYDAVSAANAWKDLPIVEPERYFGYYSSQSVCLYKLFVTTNDKSWGFSIIVTSFNFVCFMFVCVAYVIILSATKQKKSLRKQNSRAKENNQNNLQKKIIRLIVTDFCCWVPLTVMAYINVTLYELPDLCYAVAAIVLLPINSALNPILYSNAIDNLVALIKKKWHKNLRHESIKTTTSSLPDGSTRTA